MSLVSRALSRMRRGEMHPERAARSSSDSRSSSHDFRLFWIGQTISSLGNSFTLFAMPLLAFKLTGSAFTTSIAFAIGCLPYLLFSLVIGVWVDRHERKRVMIAVDCAQFIVVSVIPAIFLLGQLSIWWIYGVAFVSATLTIVSDSCQFAAIPSLVHEGDLVTANGSLQASLYGATVLGPVLAGFLLFVIPTPTLLLLDAATFLVSATMLSLIRRSFHLTADNATLQSSRRGSSSGARVESSDSRMANMARSPIPRSVRATLRSLQRRLQRQTQSLCRDIAEGLRTLFGHSVLRHILIMISLFNLLGTSREALLVVLAKEHLHATDAQFGLLNAAGAAGVVIVSLLAGPLRKRGGYLRMALVVLQIGAVTDVALAFSPTIWVALPLWALVLGSDNLWNIFSNALRQEVLPNALLGRARAVAGMMAFGMMPVGSLLGGALVTATNNVPLVYAGVGVALLLLVSAFFMPILGNAQRLGVGEYMLQSAQSRQPTLAPSSAPEGARSGKIKASMMRLRPLSTWLCVGATHRFHGIQLLRWIQRLRRPRLVWRFAWIRPWIQRRRRRGPTEVSLRIVLRFRQFPLPASLPVFMAHIEREHAPPAQNHGSDTSDMSDVHVEERSRGNERQERQERQEGDQIAQGGVDLAMR